MAGYYDRDAVNDFDDYDPEPYSGGYDQLVAYGKPIPPSEDTCYPPSTPREEEDESHGYSFGSESGPYGDRIDVERPMQKTGSEPAHGRLNPKPEHAFDEPQAYKADEFGQRPQTPNWSPPSQENELSGYSEGRKKPSYGEEDSYNKPSYHEEEEGDSYNKPHRPSYGDDEGEKWKKPSYGEEAEEPRFEKPSYHEEEEDVYNKPHRSSYGDDEGEKWKKPSYGEEAEEPRFEKPSYNEEEEDTYKKPHRPSYGDDEGEEWKKPSYGEEVEKPVPEPLRVERPNYYGGEEDHPFKKPQRPGYGQEEEESTPRFETPTFRPDEGEERPEYGGGEYEEKRYERPSYHHRRNSYTDE